MKRFFNLLMLLCPLICYSQKPLDPCCGIIKLQSPDGVTIRNNTTGRTFLIKADALDFGNLKVGDQVSADFVSSRVTGIKGVDRNYSISQPNPGAPCCTITSIKPDPVTPCCNMVGIKNNTTGEVFYIQVNKSVSSQLSTGMAVYRLETSGGTNVGPIDGDKAGPVDAGPVDGYAGFIVGKGSSAMHYTYPIKQQNGSMANQTNKAIEKTEPAIEGYQTVVAHLDIKTGETVEVQVNGRKVGSYSHGGYDVNLGHFLHAGLNNVTFLFDGGSYSKCELIGKFSDEPKGNSIYAFSPGKDVQGSFEFAYSPPKK
ncbi:MAG TPA: hypothetical protein VFQ58_02985 [Flavisolibacter sp.]|nr:hypothetical protein [Flavisolibacter sp.]